MSKYEFKCKNKKCSEYEKVLIKEMKMKEYKIHFCEKCKQELQRIYSIGGVKTFSEGFRN